MLLRSKLLAAVPHGFSLRTGGVSEGAFSSLNLSTAVGDAAQAVEQNLARLAEAGGVRGFATAHQVHGDRVLGATGAGLREVFAATEPQPDGADAVLALEPGVAAGVRVADCVPVLLFDEEQRVAAAVHSGWKGTRLQIAARGVRALQHAAGTDPGRVLAAIGPCIGRCCYEVSPELALLFRGLFGPDAADDPAGNPKPHLDLRYCVESSLKASGVPHDRIEQVAGCTSCDSTAFFSHRRDKGRTGRHLAFIAAQ